MKYLFTILMIAIHLSSSAQIPLDSFYQQGTWWCEYEWHGAGHGTWWAAGYNFRIGNDTTINSITYHKLFSDDKMFGGIRTTGERVYFIRTDAIPNPGGYRLHSYTVNSFALNQDTLLFDFNLAVGDTVKWRPQNENIVLSIDSIQLSNGKYSKRYMFTNRSAGVDEEFWIRGIGSSQGLFGGHINFFGQAPGGRSFLQYYESPNASYKVNVPGGNYSSVSYCFSTTVKNVTETRELLSLYPNPLKEDIITIETGFDVKMMTVTDMQGKVCYVHPGGMKTGANRIKLSIIPGVYIVTLLDENMKRSYIKLQKE